MLVALGHETFLLLDLVDVAGVSVVEELWGNQGEVLGLSFGLPVGEDHLLQVTGGASGVQVLGASQSAREDLVALEDLFSLGAQLLEAILGSHVSGVRDPSEGLEHDSRAEVVVASMPPIGGA